jgi:predicted small secreted protein
MVKTVVAIVLLGLATAMLSGCQMANGFVGDCKWTGQQVGNGVSSLTK